ncbi:MAG: hypothetical protein A2792_00100 [Sphingomonadales bacterium RIFCSPHIGHO2_01_FULL_65_20]|nr:MAG: hypothetical protein A2792_00100 [Sphingomonadales bacterium RIFCSPHIGHO2_01_FULL_65_20]
MFDLTRILSIIDAATRVTPAFVALAQEVIATFGEGDQEKLKERLAAARTRSDQLHDDVQDSLADAAKR